jgi:hypothetical protein
MTPRCRLRKVAQAARKRLRRLRKLVKGVDRTDVHITERSIAFATTELLTLWANFARSYYLASALQGKQTRRKRIQTSAHYSSPNDAIGAAILRFTPRARPHASGKWHRRQEPTWHDTNILLTLALDGGWSTASVVAAALSVTGVRAYVDLPVFRNFYAHRNASTQDAARACAPFYSIPQLRRVTDILLQVPQNGHEPLLVEWIDELDVVIDWLCELR